MLKYTFFALFLFVLLNLEAQPVITINQKADFIDADKMGNIYLINNTELLKFNYHGKLEYRYSNAIHGNISMVDVTNPLRIMVFYRESNALIFLNQQLSIINDAILLNDFTDAEASLACASSENGFWVFDEITMTLLYFDRYKTAQKQSVNLAEYLHEEEPIQLSEQNQELYLQTKNKIFILDTYGNLLKTLPLSSEFKVQANKSQLCYYNNTNWLCYSILSLSEKTTNWISDEQIKQAILNKNLLVLLTNNGVIIESNIKNE